MSGDGENPSNVGSFIFLFVENFLKGGSLNVSF